MPRAVDIEGTAAGVEAGGRDPPPSTPLRVVVTYAAVGGLWILFSDRLLDQLVAPGPLNVALQTAKGWVFVLAGAALLYLLMRRDARQRAAVAAQVRAVLDSIEDAILVVDPGAHVVDANRAALGMFEGLLRGEVEIPLLDLAKASQMRMADGSPVLPDAFLPARVEGETLHRTAVVLHRGEGREVQAEVTAAPILERPGGPLRFAVVVLRDVSELRRRDELQDEFLATAAHELKTPLAILRSYIETLADDLVEGLTTDQREFLAAAAHGARRLQRLVEQLLDLAALEAGHLPVAVGQVSSREVAAAVADELRPLADAGRVTLRAGVEPDLEIRADPARLRQVLRNLVENGIKYTAAGGEISIGSSRIGDRAVLCVADTGIGIPPESLPRVFDEFVRIPGHQPVDGAGLGLAIVRRLALAMGGQVWAESTPGVGSRFFVELPLWTGEG